jgi:hypothetical protein
MPKPAFALEPRRSLSVTYVRYYEADISVGLEDASELATSHLGSHSNGFVQEKEGRSSNVSLSKQTTGWVSSENLSFSLELI